MKIYYQGEKGSYHHQVSLDVMKNLNVKIDELVGLDDFEKCWDKLDDKNSILVLATENSYAGTIYDNLYKFNKYDARIIGEYDLDINHCICSTESDLSKITKVYSHFKALPQCYNYLKKHNIDEQIVASDTAGAAILLSEIKEKGAAAICSKNAGKMYGLNILDEKIQDQKNNKTRFIVIVPRSSSIKYINKNNKVSILFELKNMPSMLYRSLGAFADNNINILKIESLPNIKNPFTYLFWLDFEGDLSDKKVLNSLEKLGHFTSNIKVLGEY